MIIKLEDNEARAALAEAVEKKLSHTIAVDPEECWWEVEAGIIEEDGGIDINDIHDVRFCYNTPEDPQAKEGS